MNSFTKNECCLNNTHSAARHSPVSLIHIDLRSTGQYLDNRSLYKQIGRIMKMTFILITATLINGYSIGYSQKITLSGKHVPLESFFPAIKEQTGYVFFYNLELLKTAKRIKKLKVVNVELSDALISLFKDQPLDYSIENKTNVISEKASSEISVRSATVMLQDIKGKVVDSEGKPLTGVNVQIKGTTTGTATDMQGNFVLNVPDNGILVFSYIGFVTQEVAVNNRTSINVKLEAADMTLDEVVVIGYGTQKKVNLTGAVDVVSGEQLANRSASKVTDLIKGTSPNVNITMSFRGGEPGAESNWNIRGVGSIQGNASPLVLVDGVEMDLNNVDPESIESVSVLKDASASAIYGSRAPFGVILITTKKGGKNERVRVQYSNNLSEASPVKLSSMVDALTWATAYNQANANAGLNPVYADEQMERIKGYMAGTFPYEYDPNNPINNIFAGRRNGNANNN